MRRLFLIAFSLALTACTPWVRGDQPTAPDGIPLESGSLGQTFVARHAGLEGLEFFLEPEGELQGEISLTLHPDPGLDEVLARAELPAPNDPGFYRFTFPQRPDSSGVYYYARLTFEGTGRLRVGSAPGDAYLDGAAYNREAPLDAQLAFRTLYDPLGRIAGLARLGLRWIGVILIAGALYLLPGWALLDLLLPQDVELSALSKAALAGPAGLALYPLLFLLTDLVGLRLGPAYAWGPPLAAVLVVGIRRLKARRDHKARPAPPDTRSFAEDSRGPTVTPVLRTIRTRLLEWWRGPGRWPDLAVLLITGLVIASRFYPITRLEAPMWGDSYQHSLITRLLQERGGLFDSWQPYAEMTALTYHFGFHTHAAVLGWTTGLASQEAVLWAGQILNVLAILGLYPLALRISGSRWGGALAILVAGLLAPMPMAYVNWGRYTQLAGQVLLALAVFLAWVHLDRERMDRRLTALAWLAWAGLALTHYRVLIFGVLFFPAYLLLNVRGGGWRRVILRTFWLGLGAGLLFLPWFLHLFAGRILEMLASQLTTPPASSSVWQANNAFDFSSYGQFLAPGLWALSLAAGLFGLLRRRRALLLPCLWWGLILLAANPHWLRLPGAGALSNFAVFIAVYIPAGLLIGGAGGRLLAPGVGGPAGPEEMSTSRGRGRRGLLLGLLLVAAGVWGARARLGDVDAAGAALVTRPDLRAARWIEEETPAEARFHVNQFFAFSETVTVGSDGGWWLPLLAGRATDLPPINYGFERPPYDGYAQRVNALPRLIQERGIDAPEVLAEFRARGITHVYVGQRRGAVNYDGPARLDPQELLASPSYDPIYHQDRVWIFKITGVTQINYHWGVGRVSPAQPPRKSLQLRNP